MKRWKQRLLGVTLTVSGLIGCKQQLFISEPELNYYRSMGMKIGAPADLDTDVSVTTHPGAWSARPTPPTVNDPDRPPRYITLQEAIAIGLERGNTGSQSLQFPGITNENLQTGATDAIRAFALDPAISGARIEAALSRFDVLWASSLDWSKRDEASVNTFSNSGDFFTGSTGLYKALATGGVVGITSSMDYQKFDLSTTNANFIRFNSSYRPRLKFAIEQPLMQGYGVEINQLASVHPGAANLVSIREAQGLINQVQPSGEGREGILISRVRFDQSKTEFERNLNFLLLNVEYAYWNLYAAYGSLYARERALLEAYDVYKTLKAREKITNDPSEQYRALAQLEAFRAQRFQALGTVLESERQLRGLLGMTHDTTRLVPIDAPTTSPYMPSWEEGVAEALVNRPELIQARQDLKLRQFDMIVNKNLLKPDLRFFANYDISGLGERLDGSTEFTRVDQFGNPSTTPHNALASFTSDKFNNWEAGIRFSMPLGFRDAHAATRIARLNLIRSYVTLRDDESKVIRQLQNQYARLAEHQQTIRAQHAQLVAATDQYNLLIKRKDLTNLSGTVEALLSAQRTITDARSAEYRAIADYNSVLAAWQFSKGTLMRYDNVNIGEGALPECAQVRAADHFRERSAALVVRERAVDETGPAGIQPITQDPLEKVMPMQIDPVPSVPQMMQGVRPAGAQQMPNVPAARLPQPPWSGNGVVPAAIKPISPYSDNR